MKTQVMPHTSLAVSRIAFGCMRLSNDQNEVIKIIRTALDAGINFFDHADVYQRGRCEEAFSAMWGEIPGLRQKIIVQSKCGIRFAGDTGPGTPKRYDFSYAHIMEAVEGSLRRLRTDYLDILLLHRPDPLVDPDEVAKAFTELQEDGKVRHFGVSNHSGPQIDLLQKALPMPLVANQLEFNVLHTPLIDMGVITNQSNPPSVVRGDWTMEYCRLHEITIQAWSPLARGAIGGKPLAGAEARAAKTAEIVADMARDHKASVEAVLIAWILKHPAKIQAIIGTMNPERVKACCQADTLELSREEWWRLWIAGRGAELP